MCNSFRAKQVVGQLMVSDNKRIPNISYIWRKGDKNFAIEREQEWEARKQNGNFDVLQTASVCPQI